MDEQLQAVPLGKGRRLAKPPEAVHRKRARDITTIPQSLHVLNPKHNSQHVEQG